MAPIEARLDNGGRQLRLVGADRALSAVAADLLWEHCPSASFRRRRIDGQQLIAPPGIAIVEVRPVGRYGVNLAFSDGNDRGIYPWALLAELAARPTVDDFLLPAAGTAAQDNQI